MFHQSIIKPTAEEVAIAATSWLIETMSEAIAERGTCSLALSGGSTPKRMYELIGQKERESLDWSKVVLVWGDERNVEPDHADSNYRMVHQAWLDHWRAEPGLPMPVVMGVSIQVQAPERAAAAYEQTLRARFQSDRQDSFPALDVVLLGLGDDAHTASLFPETEALKEHRRWFVANYIPKFAAYRLTMTAPSINAARNVAFLVCGGSKQAAVETVLHGPRRPELYPAQMIQPTDGRLCWFMDSAASEKSRHS